MRENLKFLMAGATLGLGCLLVAGCGTEVSGPGFLSENCLVDDPPPSCQEVDPPVQNVVPAGLEHPAAPGAPSDPS